MPYIKNGDNRRELLRGSGEVALSAGELNYQIFYRVKHCEMGELNVSLSKDIAGFVSKYLGENPNYQKYNDISGVLLMCFKEIKRRLKVECPCLLEILSSYDQPINEYEDAKRDMNGDVE